MDHVTPSSSEVYFSSENLDAFKLIFAEMPIPMILVDKFDTIVFLNKAYARYLDLDVEKCLGKPVLSIIKKSNIPTVIKTSKALIGVPHPLFVDSHNKPAICHCIPIIKDGECIACLGMILFHGWSEINRLSTKLANLQNELSYYKQVMVDTQQTKYSVDDIVGDCPAMRKMKNALIHLSKNIGATRPTLLITGESGTGKELVAQSFHNLGRHRSKPFVRLNCAAIPENLFESELFGYADGAFTGAKKGGMPGKFEQANHGTIFLDEVGELSLVAQAKLLRVLQEREVTRIGGNTVIPVDVCVIAATNRQLDAMVRAGEFRQDLFYRLDVMHITVPPLRERGQEDIRLLTETFLEQLSAEYGMPKIIDPAIWEVFDSYAWPGNVRELRNVVEKMYLSAEIASITPQNIPHSIYHSGHPSLAAGMPEAGFSLDETVARMEQDAVAQALKYTDNNISKAADLLNISRPRIYRILKRMEGGV